MIGVVVRRLLLLIPLLLFVSFVVFSLVLLIPGDPAVTLAGGENAQPAQIEKVRQELHLDEPFLKQYTRWLGGAIHGDFGTSFETNRPISDELGQRLPVTLGLVFATMLLVIPFALIIGISGGLKPGSVTDKALMVGSSLAMSIPAFLLGLVLVIIFAVWLKILPPYGYTPFAEDPVQWARYIVLPAIALGCAAMAVTSRQVRSGISDTMNQPYVRTAWAKGG